MLTKILAARLPTAGYLPVRVVLRDIPADADVQDQIEYAVRAATGERVSWPELVRAAGSAVPVLLFDGFDELLQATGVSQTDFLIRVARFQEREADQGRPVFALVTSRTAVADRARYPAARSPCGSNPSVAARSNAGWRVEPAQQDRADRARTAAADRGRGRPSPGARLPAAAADDARAVRRRSQRAPGRGG